MKARRLLRLFLLFVLVLLLALFGTMLVLARNEGVALVRHARTRPQDTPAASKPSTITMAPIS